MIKKLAILTCCLAMAPTISWAAPCSRINLTKCLDSACAINISANPAARCQYCGTADAGEPTVTMRSVSSASSKNTIPSRELQNAPTDPGKRYIWATTRCLEIVQNCTVDDVTDAYDPLIEKSCTATSVGQNMSSLQKKASSQKSKNANTCTDEISLCIIADNKCGSDFSNCTDDEKFSNFFATCSTTATGCTSFLDSARKTITETRKNITKALSANVNSIVASHIQDRIDNISMVNNACANNKAFNDCVKKFCKDGKNGICTNDTEQKIANNMCEYHKTACKKVKTQSTSELQRQLDKMRE